MAGASLAEAGDAAGAEPLLRRSLAHVEVMENPAVQAHIVRDVIEFLDATGRSDEASALAERWASLFSPTE